MVPLSCCAGVAGEALDRLQQEREASFMERFERTFGKLDDPGLPAGNVQSSERAMSSSPLGLACPSHATVTVLAALCSTAVTML